jgi:prephenate dehydratase
MPKTIISVSAIPGSFTEEAAKKFIHDQKLTAMELTYDGDPHGTFAAVSEGRADYGIVPIENSNSGLVMASMYAAAEYVFTIHSMVEISVQQNLITAPGVDRDDITTITSQLPALDQCKAYLRHLWKGVKIEGYVDTALAVKDLASGKLPRTTAVIASRAAAELYHLPILEPSIQDLKFNFTAFMVVTKKKDS